LALKRRRRIKKVQAFVPSPAMEESRAFVLRENVGSALPAECVHLLFDALDVFDEEPEIRGGEWCFKGYFPEYRFNLLGLLCSSSGLALVDHPRNGHELLCRDFLERLGFTSYDILCIQEIDSMSSDLEVLRERLGRFITSGERMPFDCSDIYGEEI
jgi:hypothetical protein